MALNTYVLQAIRDIELDLRTEIGVKEDHLGVRRQEDSKLRA